MTTKLITTINSHELVAAKDGGNGYHGYCKHCGCTLETDLGWCSWDGVKCVDREPVDLYQMTEVVRSYANYAGYRFNRQTKRFVKAYESKTYTIRQFYKLVDNLTVKHNYHAIKN